MKSEMRTPGHDMEDLLMQSNPKPETRNPKPETRNPKPETRNPETEGVCMQINPDSAKAYKTRGRAAAMLGR
jgi:hypothetical protein